MRVGRVEAFAVRYPESNNDGKIRALTLVRVETDDGLVGWGEAITGGQETSLAVAFVVERRLAPLVVGQRPARRRGRLEPPARRDVTGTATAGLVTFGISAIDMALWDIAGQGRRASRSTALLGGKRRDRLPACASTIFATHDLDRVGREFRGFVAEGYRYVKGGWGHDLSIAFGQRRAARSGDRPRRPRRDRARRPHDRRRRRAHGLGLEPRHPDVPGDRRRRPPLLVRGPPGRAGPRRVPAAPRRRGHAHLHRGEGLARRALPDPHRVRRDRRHHDRPRPGGGRDRDLARHRDGGGGRARLERALLEQRAQHRGRPPPGRRRVQHAASSS